MNMEKESEIMEFVAESFLPTRFGKFRIYAFKDGSKEHIAIVGCDHNLHQGVPVRVHSKCFTGDTLCSKRCDCRDQLEYSMKYIKKCGMIIYLDQEGRGIGLSNKIKAYALQDQGADTLEANLKLGFVADSRDYYPAAEILNFFKLKKIKLLTNNPLKIEDLKIHGIEVVERIPIKIKPNSYNKKYLKTKKEKMDHLL